MFVKSPEKPEELCIRIGRHDVNSVLGICSSHSFVSEVVTKIKNKSLPSAVNKVLEEHDACVNGFRMVDIERHGPYFTYYYKCAA